MATLSLTFDKSSYNKGETITATYTVTGADDVPASTVAVPVSGTSVVDGQTLSASGTIDVTTPAVTHTKTYQAPTADGLTFTATSNPRVWTAIA